MDVPHDRGGGRIYKKTYINEFNSNCAKIDPSRLSRMKASSKIIADTEVAQSAKKKARSGGVGSGGGSSVEGYRERG